MQFTIFKKTGERHFDHDGFDDYDGDDGEDIEIEVDDETVHEDICKMIYSHHLRDALKRYNIQPDTRQRVIERFRVFFDDLEVWDALESYYADELQDKYERQYADY